jgi:hypothetical protein
VFIYYRNGRAMTHLVRQLFVTRQRQIGRIDPAVSASGHLHKVPADTQAHKSGGACKQPARGVHDPAPPRRWTQVTQLRQPSGISSLFLKATANVTCVGIAQATTIGAACLQPCMHPAASCI